LRIFTLFYCFRLKPNFLGISMTLSQHVKELLDLIRGNAIRLIPFWWDI
jgi:hypothetical protein